MEDGVREVFTVEVVDDAAGKWSENSTVLEVEDDGGGDTEDSKGVEAADRGCIGMVGTRFPDGGIGGFCG